MDDILVQGSPGMHVDSADDLQVGKGHVWALEAPDDNIAEFGSYAHGGVDSYTRPQDRVIPGDERFGGVRLEANSGGHNSYWDETNGRPDRSLDNQRRVVMGMYDSPNPADRPVVETLPDPKLA
ncbi:alpha/beta hydrolase [Yinghuangia soli]|uniref:Alpha/beta hydrolase family protein n=1 Tax=Yinghuangia soli TaxID=2908204 RepID=A0AA41Q3M3_9ACTN|nr:alpha/beta hydrolase [Yinghuangia soli]MCF2530948.1 alpha/beta hydrolase family protein [Yinghuangia soli]